MLRFTRKNSGGVMDDRIREILDLLNQEVITVKADKEYLLQKVRQLKEDNKLLHDELILLKKKINYDYQTP